MIYKGQTAIICSNHLNYPEDYKINGHYKEYSMKEGAVTYQDKLDPTKTIREDYLMCPRCFQTVLITQPIREVLDELKANGSKPTKRTNTTTEATPATI